MWLSAAVHVVSIDGPIGNLGGVVQPEYWSVNGLPEQMVLHRQVNPSPSGFRSNGREDTFEHGKPINIISLDVREVSDDGFGWVFQNSAQGASAEHVLHPG